MGEELNLPALEVLVEQRVRGLPADGADGGEDALGGVDDRERPREPRPFHRVDLGFDVDPAFGIYVVEAAPELCDGVVTGGAAGEDPTEFPAAL